MFLLVIVVLYLIKWHAFIFLEVLNSLRVIPAFAKPSNAKKKQIMKSINSKIAQIIWLANC